MRAIRRSRYGGPETLEIADVEDEPLEEGRVRLRVAAASLNPFEWHHLRGLPWLMRPTSGWRHPRNPGLGVDVAGVVTEVADDVADLRVGDAVFGVARNSLAESATARAEYLVRIPDGVEPEAAAAVPLAGLTALQALRDQGQMTAGSRVLILGAAGGVGHYAVQVARALDAGRVVASCSGRNASWVEGLGADERKRLRKIGVTLGALDLFDPRLLKPGAQGWRRALYAARGWTLPTSPDAATVLARGERGATLAAGYRPLARQAVRVDLVERIARALHDARPKEAGKARAPFAPDTALATSMGLEPATIERLMLELGFRPARGGEGQRWAWRGRPRPKRREEKPSATGAFAGLADLVRHG